MMRRVAATAVLLAVLSPAPVQAAQDPLRSRQYALDVMRVPAAWTISRGAGVVIAIMDTGVDLQHEDLRDRLVAGHDYIDGDEVPSDENGHGTHVAGIAAAATDNGIGVAGVAPASLIMPMRVLDRSGTGTEQSVAAAVDLAVRRAAALSVRLVINLSLTDLNIGGVARGRTLPAAVERAWRAGAVIIAAAGNDSLPYTEYPAAGPNVLAVGASDASDGRASFSNRGPLVVAPGDAVVSTYFDPSQPSDHGAYASGAGTSMAAPHVAGVAALLLAQGLTNRQVVDRIIATSDDLGAQGVDAEFGYGRVNAARALGSPDVGTGRVVGVDSLPRPGKGRFQEIERPTPVAAAPGRPGPRGRGGIVSAAVVLAMLALAAVIVGRLPRAAPAQPDPLPQAPRSWR